MTNSRMLYLATTNGVVMLTQKPPEQWQVIGLELAKTPLESVTCSANNANLAHVWSVNRAWQTVDGGQTWTELDYQPAPLPLRHFELSNSKLRLNQTSALLEQSFDGETWQIVELATEGAITALCVAAPEPDLVFAATNHGELWHSADAGQIWHQIKRDRSPIQAIAYGVNLT